MEGGREREREIELHVYSVRTGGRSFKYSMSELTPSPPPLTSALVRHVSFGLSHRIHLHAEM